MVDPIDPAVEDVYVVVRYGGGGSVIDGGSAGSWTSIGSAMFRDLEDADAFAARLDRAKVFRLVEVQE